VRMRNGEPHVGMEPVVFSRVRPGQTLVSASV